MENEICKFCCISAGIEFEEIDITTCGDILDGKGPQYINGVQIRGIPFKDFCHQMCNDGKCEILNRAN